MVARVAPLVRAATRRDRPAARWPRPAWTKSIARRSLRESSAELRTAIILPAAAARSVAAPASRSLRTASRAAPVSAPPCPPLPRARRNALVPAAWRVAIGAPLVRATMATQAPWPSPRITLVRSPRRPRKSVTLFAIGSRTMVERGGPRTGPASASSPPAPRAWRSRAACRSRRPPARPSYPPGPGSCREAADQPRQSIGIVRAADLQAVPAGEVDLDPVAGGSLDHGLGWRSLPDDLYR